MAAQVAAYVDFKRTMGFVYDGGERCLTRFAEYCAERGFESVSRDACLGFGVERGGWSRELVSCLRGFARWVRLHGDPKAYELPSSYAPRKARPEVYLLAAGEVEAFFAAAAGLDYTPPWPWQATAFFAVMASCGLRPCEARRLTPGDVDPSAGTVLVRDSKGPRTRLLPVTSEVVDILTVCDAANNKLWPDRQTLFAGCGGGPVHPKTPRLVFNMVWDQARLPRPSGPPYPRPYSFRHRFACVNIEQWSSDGVDADAMLPYLTRYMGHASPESTLYYLHISPDYLHARAGAAQTSAALLPEVGFDA
jgi:integrase